ncbi:MAG: hypothetical protein J6T87_00360 [Bacteroidales bacterium]|nr:hypothetical protein [Bacteroidales bacterium]
MIIPFNGHLHTNPIRLILLLSELSFNDIGIGMHVYVLAGGLALAGFILGFTNWALDVPPKFFWTQSRVQLFDNRVGNALGYAVIFFLLPFFVAGVVFMVGKW